MEKYLGEQIPKLGFGFMRLPTEENGAIDIAQTTEMVDMYMASGFYYFDTAYGYQNGESEKAIKKTLVDRYPRDKYLLATKLPAWSGAKNKAEAERMFDISLERTGAGYFDFYLLHNLGEVRTHYFNDYDIWNYLSKKKADGLIKHLGFSFHDKAAALDKVLSDHPEMEFVQLQINYADWENPSIESRKCYETARKHGKPVIIMEPVKGGNLADPPPQVTELFNAADPKASPSSWAIRYAASLEGIITVLSGMSNLEQMKDNLSYMRNFQPLTPAEQATIKKAADLIAACPNVPCTSCAYCMKDCPKSIAIYGTFEAVNMFNRYDSMERATKKYTWNTTGHGWGKASTCIACGKCEAVCPQHIPIREELKKAAELFEK